MKKNKLLVILLFFIIGFVSEAKCCTAFVLKNGGKIIVGRNYDYRSSLGVLMINQDRKSVV